MNARPRGNSGKAFHEGSNVFWWKWCGILVVILLARHCPAQALPCNEVEGLRVARRKQGGNNTRVPIPVFYFGASVGSSATHSPVMGSQTTFARVSSYLVDPASSHMLVSKTKPCMCKYKPVHGETANGSLNQLWFLRSFSCTLDNCSNSRANTCTKALILSN